MQFPPNATKDESNFELNLDGTRSRRLGMDTESFLFDTVTGTTEINSLGYSNYIWESPGGDTSKKFSVVQVGSRIYIFDALAPVIASAFLESFGTGGSPDHVWDYASYGGKLYIVTGTPNIKIISYSSVTNAFTEDIQRITIRDLFGVEETIEPKYETDPQYRGALNPQHYYNLYNQSWAIPRFPWLYGDNPLQNAAAMAGAPTKSPSNSDTVWMGLDYRNVSRESVGTPPSGSDPGDQSFFFNSVECFNKKQFDAVIGEQGLAPKGHYIIDAFNIGASRSENLLNTVAKYPESGGLYETIVFQDIIYGGPNCCAAYSGRLFYSGCEGQSQFGDKRTPDYSNFVFFSQLVQKQVDATRCYQDGDPTSRENNDILDTDGGFIKVAGAGGILRLMTIGQKLIVVARNGIWAISGEDNGAFKATSYKVDKISSNGCVGKFAVIDAGETLYYCGTDAIYSVQSNQFGDLQCIDVTSDRIKKFYASLTLIAKNISHGAYDPFTNRIHWVFYNSNGAPTLGVSTTILSLDIKLGSFYKYNIETATEAKPVIFSAFLAPDINKTGSAGSTPNVNLSPQLNKIKFAGIAQIEGRIHLFYSEFKNKDFKDWPNLIGGNKDAKAYILTGENTLGDVGIKKQLNYLSVVMKNTEKTIFDGAITRESSCTVRCMWDFADSIVSNKWSSPSQVFRRLRIRENVDTGDFYTGHEYITTKSKMRGRGRVFSLFFETEELKDCQLVGWNMEVTTNGVS